MGFAATTGLGLLAGVTIFLGLPIARIGRPRPALMAFLNSASVGVLLFILYDVIKNANAPIEDGLNIDRVRGIGYALVLGAGLAVSLLGLVVFQRLARRPRLPLTVERGPGAMVAPEAHAKVGQNPWAIPSDGPLRVAILIAVGIGLHNFSEGLAIGQSAAGGAYRLLYVLVIGFGLHNITEGFGITAPLIGQRPSWRFLGLCGLIGGGPTFLGAMLGHQFVNPVVSILFLALAAGAIIYVIGELQHAGRRIGCPGAAGCGILAGFLAGYGTDLILHVAGA